MNHLDLGFRLWCIGVQRWTLYTCTLEMMLSAKLAFKLDTASGCQGPHPDSGLKREQDPEAAKATQFFTSKVNYSTYQYLCTYTYTTESDSVWLRHKKCPENCGLRHCRRCQALSAHSGSITSKSNSPRILPSLPRESHQMVHTCQKTTWPSFLWAKCETERLSKAVPFTASEETCVYQCVLDLCEYKELERNCMYTCSVLSQWNLKLHAREGAKRAGKKHAQPNPKST